MGFFNTHSQEVLGIQVDGHQVLAAHMQRDGDHVALLGMARRHLPQRLDEDIANLPESSEPVETVDDILGLETEAVEGGPSIESPDGENTRETPAEVFYQLLNKFPLDRCTIALSMMETSVFYVDFDTPVTSEDKPLKGKKLKQHVLAETVKDRPNEDELSMAERHDCFNPGPDRLLSVLHEDPLHTLQILDDLKPFIGRVQIDLIEPLEITLMNVVRTSCAPFDGITALVYVGEDFSRVLFLKNDAYIGFSLPIHAGVGTPQILETLYSRILFEQDMANLPDVRRVLLCGGARTIDAQPFFKTQFPDARVAYLQSEFIDLSDLKNEDRALTSDFAVPIGLCLKALNPKDERFYPINFLPRARRRQQNPLELAWHGVASLALLTGSLLFLGIQAQHQSQTMTQVQHSIDFLDQHIHANKPYVALVDSLNARIREYEQNFALIDSLAADRLTWSPQLHVVATAAKTTGGVWLERFSTAESNLEIQNTRGVQSAPLAQSMFVAGKSAYRSRIPKLSTQLGAGQIRSIVRSKIRQRTIYGFDFQLPVMHIASE